MIRMGFLIVFAIGTIWGHEVKAAGPYPPLACRSILAPVLSAYRGGGLAKLVNVVAPLVSLMKDLDCPLAPLKSGVECVANIPARVDTVEGALLNNKLYSQCFDRAAVKYK